MITTTKMSQTVVILLQLLTLFVVLMNSEIHRDYILEGDMLLTEEQLKYIFSDVSFRNANLFTDRWPDKVLIYDFADDVSNNMKYVIEQTIKIIERNSCVRMRRRYADDTSYVLIQNGSGCSSFIGRKGGVQIMNLNEKYCYIHGKILHEFLHALGFVHMHSDPTRDDFVKIHEENIDPMKFKRNFMKYSTNISSLGVLYDYGSIMHYPKNAFSINKKVTVETINPANTYIGQRVKLSKSDIKKLNRLYEC